MSAPDRLLAILRDLQIRSFKPFGSIGHGVVAFSEGTTPGIRGLIERDGQYQPWGLGFTKDFVYRKGGGPVFYVRGDLWSTFEQVESTWIKSFATRFWPGALGLHADADWGIQSMSEWVHEREWRIPYPPEDTAPRGMTFVARNVAVLVLAADVPLPEFVADLPEETRDALLRMNVDPESADAGFRIFRRPRQA